MMRERIGIVGAGAMGCMFGARLALVGHDVTLIDVDPHQIAAINDHGLRLDADDGSHRVAVTAATAGDVKGDFAFLLLFTKAHHSAAALASVAHLHTPATWLLTLQNGLGGGERAAATIGRDRIAIGMTSWPADIVAPAHVATHGSGTVRLWSLDGAADPMLDRISASLDEAGLASRADPAVTVAIWEKAIFNAVMNPVAALTRLTVGGIAASVDARALVDALLDEAFAIAAAAKVAIDPARITANITFALADHGSHQPSMLKDLLAERRTEIDVINGALVDIAHGQGIAAPLHGTLLRLVRAAQPG